MIGQTLEGTYRVSEMVGSGGFAAVYLGRDVRTNSVVAIKVLHEHYRREAAVVERFLTGAGLAQRLTERHVARVLAVGRDGDVPYVVMEYVEGHSLLALARAGLSCAEVVDLGCQTLQALDAAHRAGIVHRDIKPGNLMRTPEGQVKVLDFDLAKQAASVAREASRFVGTPHYMAPEQVGGATVDGRADLYAVGVSLFEMLAGRPPFDGQSDWAILEHQVRTPPPAVRTVRGDVPPRLDAVVRRAMAKDPARRFQTAAEMQSALAAAGLAGGKASVGRSTWIAVAVAAGTGAVVLGSVLLGTGSGRVATRASATPIAGQGAVATSSPVAASPVSAVPIETPVPTSAPPAVVDPTPTLSPLDTLQVANAERMRGDYEAALKRLDQLVVDGFVPDGLDDAQYKTLMEYGRRLLDRGEHANAATQFRAAGRFRPRDPDATSGLVEALRPLADASSGIQPSEAVAYADELVEVTRPITGVAGKSAEHANLEELLYNVLLRQARRLRDQGETAAAIPYVERARTMRPAEAEARELLLQLQSP